MSKKASDDKIKSAEKASEMAKKIWLAGLGAYGRAFDGASGQLDKLNEQYEKVSKETTHMFDELVVKGKKLDSESQSKLSTAKTKTTATIEDRINKVRSSLSMGGNSVEMSHLNEKMDVLTAKVDALLDALVEPKKGTTKVRSSSAA